MKEIFNDNQKKDARRSRLPGILAVLLLLSLPVISSDQNPVRMVVQTKECNVRSAPSFLANDCGKLEYNDLVQVQEEKGAWRKIAAEKKKVSGWVPLSSLVPPTIMLRDGTVPVAGRDAGSGEIVTAGRSIFSEETESAIRAKYPDLKFDLVNKMESLKARNDKIVDFARKGGLLEEEKK